VKLAFKEGNANWSTTGDFSCTLLEDGVVLASRSDPSVEIVLRGAWFESPMNSKTAPQVRLTPIRWVKATTILEASTNPPYEWRSYLSNSTYLCQFGLRCSHSLAKQIQVILKDAPNLLKPPHIPSHKSVTFHHPSASAMSVLERLIASARKPPSSPVSEQSREQPSEQQSRDRAVSRVVATIGSAVSAQHEEQLNGSSVVPKESLSERDRTSEEPISTEDQGTMHPSPPEQMRLERMEEAQSGRDPSALNHTMVSSPACTLFRNSS
jgi:hypothetical protein